MTLEAVCLENRKNFFGEDGVVDFGESFLGFLSKSDA